MWKLVSLRGVKSAGGAFDTTLHFADEQHFYDCSQGELSRHRYEIRPDLAPAQLDIDGTQAIYKIESGMLVIAEALPGQSRPTDFNGASVAVYEYVGQGPPNWRAVYKQQIRDQMKRVADRFCPENGAGTG